MFRETHSGPLEKPYLRSTLQEVVAQGALLAWCETTFGDEPEQTLYGFQKKVV